MTVFATKGVAWDGQPWVLAPALVTYTNQIVVYRPGGPWIDDGTVASKGHDAANPNSDHTVWPQTGAGVVYAVDVHESAPNVIDELAESLRKSRDPRLKYFIHDGRMFSSYSNSARSAWQWGEYTGYNDHEKHGHLSIYHTAGLANDTSQWAVPSGSKEEAMLPLVYGHGYVTPPEDSNLVGDQTHKKDDVQYIQHLLRRAGWTGAVTKRFDAATVEGVKAFGGSNDGDVYGWVLDNLQAAAWKVLIDKETDGQFVKEVQVSK